MPKASKFNSYTVCALTVCCSLLPFPSSWCTCFNICSLWGKKIGKSQKGPSQLPQLLSCVFPSQIPVPCMLNFHKSFLREAQRLTQGKAAHADLPTQPPPCVSGLNSRSPLLLQVDPESGNHHLEFLKYHLYLFPAHTTLKTTTSLSLSKAKSHKHPLEGLCLGKTGRTMV